MTSNVINKQTGKPEGMSDKAWINLHKVLAKIHLNHREEIEELQRKKNSPPGKAI